jgi:hypothetical protein
VNEFQSDERVFFECGVDEAVRSRVLYLDQYPKVQREFTPPAKPAIEGENHSDAACAGAVRRLSGPSPFAVVTDAGEKRTTIDRAVKALHSEEDRQLIDQ